MSVCVCTSATRRYSVKTVKHTLKLFLHWGSHIILVFFRTKRHGNTPTSFCRASAHWRAIDIAILSVRPSVRVSVCPWRSCITWKRLKHYCHCFLRYGSPIILVFQHQTSSRNSDGVTASCGGAKYRWGINILRFSTNKSLYIADDTRLRHGYYGRRRGTRMRSIKWCHFQWPWTNSNPVSKVILWR